MKKFFAIIALLGIISIGATNNLIAQPEGAEAAAEAETPDTNAENQEMDTAETEEIVAAETESVQEETNEAEEGQKEVPIHQRVKSKFIEGGAGFMGFVLLCLIFGLAFVIERIIYLNLATTNTEKLLKNVEDALAEGGVEAAKEVCRNTRGPVASIFYQGLDRMDQGLDVVEKSIISYGGVQMGLLEKNLSWISLFIAIAPMLGFMGTVIGMIGAFDNIREAGNVSPQIVAGGIGVALITTVSGLIVAVILQLFYNYLLAKIDSIVNNMEDASISLVDILVKHNNDNASNQ